MHCNVQQYTDIGGFYVHINLQQYTDSGLFYVHGFCNSTQILEVSYFHSNVQQYTEIRWFLS
jgi:hypothetical protein